MKHLVCIPIFLLFCTAESINQTVPKRMTFAGIELSISTEARKRIQDKVDSLRRNSYAFQEVIDRKNLFFPIIEPILEEEQVPDDFKYLVLQESALISDAVSSSNAIGFWQFMPSAAQEMKLNINRESDDRMHIIASTRAAAGYLKKNQSKLNNWIYALLSYNEGLGGVQKFVKKTYQHKTSMVIEDDAHQYIIHYLAHKIAFSSLPHETHPALQLYPYYEGHGKTLREIASEFQINLKPLQDYNKWLRLHIVPLETTWPTMIPLSHVAYQQLSYQQYQKHTGVDPSGRDRLNYQKLQSNPSAFPTFNPIKHTKKLDANRVIRINGLYGIKACLGDTVSDMARSCGITVDQWRTWNDVDSATHPIPGQVYYGEPKYTKGPAHYHIARPEDSWWSISQQYGIQKAALLSKNRLRKETKLQEGRVVWMRFIRPVSIPISYQKNTKSQ